jgi:membrane protein YqaA with SNARE-associated domain
VRSAAERKKGRRRDTAFNFAFPIEVSVRTLARLNEYLMLMGIPGLLAVAFLDSAAVPLPGGPDAVIIVLSWQRPALALLIAVVAALGSTLGCFVLYGIGRKGGEKALARFDARKTEWVRRKMEQHGVWAIMAAVVAPPPFPTKLLILAAGVLQTGKTKFACAVMAGRLVRYGFIAYLGAHFGSRAADILKAHYPAIGLTLVGIVLLAIVIRALRSSRKSAPGDASAS